MSYTIERAVQKLWRNRVTYLFLMLELTIGMTVTLCGFLSSSAAQERLTLYQGQLTAADVLVEYYGDSTEPAITCEDYRELMEQYGERGSFTFFLYGNSIYQTSAREGVSDVTIIVMNADAFSRRFGQAQQNAVYVGEQVAQDLAAGELMLAEQWLSLEGDVARIGEQANLPVLPLRTQTEKLITRTLESADLSVRQLVILPETLMDDLSAEMTEQISFLRVTPNEGEDAGFLNEITEELAGRHSDYTYSLVAQGAELEQAIADLTQGVRLLSWVARLALLITTAGMIGNLFLLLQRRRREYAIAFSVGAAHNQILAEVFCEVLLLTGASGVIAVLLSATLTPSLSTSMYTASFRWSALAVMLLTVGSITICACVCALLGSHSDYPAKQLRG